MLYLDMMKVTQIGLGQESLSIGIENDGKTDLDTQKSFHLLMKLEKSFYL